MASNVPNALLHTVVPSRALPVRKSIPKYPICKKIPSVLMPHSKNNHNNIIRDKLIGSRRR